MSKLSPIIKESFAQYAGAVLQSRAIVDVRDCIKPSARQIFYSMKLNKLDADHPFKKSNNAIGLAMADFYIHGDASCEGIIMRSAQPFTMRYPVVEVQGGGGNLMETSNWSAPRYTESRLAPLAAQLFDDIDKDTINEWRDSYDDTKQYPAVLPTKGYYNICNGTMGIGVGMGSSIPQFNLKEVNAALERLLLNPNIANKELICLPDFATGGLLLNADEVKESLMNGSGKACQLRSVIEYDDKDHCLVVSEIPYGVYTNTICGELEQIIEGEDNPGIERFNDLTGEKPLIKIYLVKGASPIKIMNYLFKNTSLQSWYSINMVMLDNGRYPKQFTWKDALSAHIEHEKIVYRRGFEFDLNKAKARKHIVEGIIIAIANIDEVVATIKQSYSTVAANKALCEKFNLDEEQAKAILAITLSRLARLEVDKFEKELAELNKTIDHLVELLNNEQLFNNELIKGWRNVAAKFGDARRTKITTETNEVEVIKPQPVVNLVWSNGNIAEIEPPKDKVILNKKGSPFAKNDIICGYTTTTTSTSYVFTAGGKIVPINNNSLNIGVPAALNCEPVVCGLKAFEGNYLITVAKSGLVKKTPATEFGKVNRVAQVVKLHENDCLVWAGMASSDDDYLLLFGENNRVVKFKVGEIKPTGKVTYGMKGIDDKVVCAAIVSKSDNLIIIADGKIKVLSSDYFSATGRGVKGHLLSNKIVAAAKGEEQFYVADGGKLLHYFAANFISNNRISRGTKISENINLKIIT